MFAMVSLEYPGNRYNGEDPGKGRLVTGNTKGLKRRKVTVFFAASRAIHPAPAKAAKEGTAIVKNIIASDGPGI
jgi:hypothetical protein